MNRHIVHGGLVAALLALAACNQTAKVDPTAGGGGLAGNWAPETGGYTAIFDNGSFRTVASDTGNVISQGSYIAQSEKEVQLNWSSNITGQQNSAKCARPNAQVLNCVDGGGKSFTLRRVAS